MSTPAAKRRRIEAMNTAVSKPFRSPFRGPKDTSTTSTIPLPSTPSTPAPAPAPSTAPLQSSLPPSPAISKSTAPAQRLALRALNADPTIVSLLKAQRQLDSQLRALKEQLDVAEQAGRIEQASARWSVARKATNATAASKPEGPDFEIDGELRELIGKWTAASRMAAEELFGGVRDRINRMGGPVAFRQAQEEAARRQREFQAEWDEGLAGEGREGDEGEEREGGERDLYAEYGGGEVETENERRARGGEERAGDGGGDGDGEEFTMAMMLRTLNVDLKVIGYDQETQRWSD